MSLAQPASPSTRTDEDILTYTVSDEAIEAAAGMAGGQQYTPDTNIPNCSLSPGQCCADRPEQVRSLVNSFEYEEQMS